MFQESAMRYHNIPVAHTGTNFALSEGGKFDNLQRIVGYFIFGCCNWGYAALASWKRPGTVLNILQYTGHSVDKELSPAKCQWFCSGVSLPHLANKMENCSANNGWQGCRERGTLLVEIWGQTAFEESNLATCMQFNSEPMPVFGVELHPH